MVLKIRRLLSLDCRPVESSPHQWTTQIAPDADKDFWGLNAKERCPRSIGTSGNIPVQLIL